MEQYRDLCYRILDEGVQIADRTGVGTRSVFGHQMRFNMEDGFPLLALKQTSFPLIKSELLWFLRGDTNIQFLLDHNNHIWDEWADENGDLGPVYGKQWRSWGGDQERGLYPVDQIADVIEQIKTNPYSRRHIVSAWNPSEVDDMALPPCHTLFQFYVTPSEDPTKADRLSLHLYQRSGDVFLGVPFNIASYSLLLHMVAQVTSLRPYEFVHTLGDAHIYSNHIEQTVEMLMREERPLPSLRLDQVASIDDFTMGGVRIFGYDPHPAIKGEVAV